jgi:hypothetical protein
MPSRQECVSFYGDHRLANAITRRKGGWYTLAKDLGLSIKDSETYVGKMQEEVACEMLKERGFETERMPQNFPYDILVDNCVKIDVKASRLYRGENGNFFSFNIEKKYATCDIYILLTLNDDGEVTSTFVVPSVFVIKNTQISIGERNSKYHCFKDRWDYISNLSKFCGEVVLPQNRKESSNGDTQ